MNKPLPYVISEVPNKYRGGNSSMELWYCHRRSLPSTPVFGSIGDKEKAAKVCREMNGSLGYGRKVGTL